MKSTNALYFSLILIWTTFSKCQPQPTDAAGRKMLLLEPRWEVIHRLVGERYVVSCSALDESIDSLDWKGPNNAQIPTLERSNGRAFYKVSNSATTVNLVFKNVSLDHSGEYSCFGRIGPTLESEHFTLAVTLGASVSCPASVSVTEHEDAVIPCKVLGVPRPTVTVRFNDQLVEQSADGVRWNENENELIIGQAEASRAGNYTLSVYQSPFQYHSNFAVVVLIVYHAPKIVEPERAVTYGYLNEVTELKVVVDSNPPSWFKWSRYDLVIHPTNSNTTVRNGRSTTVLQVPLYDSRYEGSYTLEACNQLGCANYTTSLKGVARLVRPTIGLWLVDSTEVHIYVRTQRNALAYRFEWLPLLRGADPLWHLANVTEQPKKTPNLNKYALHRLKGLYPDTRYVVRVASLNKYVRSPFSEAREFVTKMGTTNPALYCSPSVADGRLHSVRYYLVSLTFCVLFWAVYTYYTSAYAFY